MVDPKTTAREAHAETGAETHSQTDSQTHAKTHSQTGAEADAPPDAATDAETRAKTDAQAHTATLCARHPKAVAVSDTVSHRKTPYVAFLRCSSMFVEPNIWFCLLAFP